MRVWICSVFILLIGTFYSASASPASVQHTTIVSSAKLVIMEGAAIHNDGRSEHCDQLEDTEVITAVYTQHPTFGPAAILLLSGGKNIIYPLAASRFLSRRDNALIKPFYQRILFPFHGFW